MNGGVIANTPIAVDFWKIRECPQARVFFLSHLHGDHVTGLTSSWNYPIYCSEVTGQLLKQRYGLREKLIHTLQIDSAQIVYLDKEHKEQMTVTALDANHCPGSIMFLFEGYFGTILHTGDFRFGPDMIESSPLALYSGQVDTLYLDNTYCSPACDFPTRDEATDHIISIIETHPSHNIVIGMRNLGKEDLLCKLAIHLQEIISVPISFFETLQILGAPDVFENNSSDCRIRVVPFHTVSNKLVNWLNKTSPTLAILPTAIYCGIDARPYENQENVFVVPYSDHSSYTEIVKFVSFIKPRKIIPIVKGSSRGPFGCSLADRADMTCFSKYIQTECIQDIDVPETVRAYMNDPTSRPPHQGEQKLKRKGRGRKFKKTAGSKHARRGVIYDSSSSHTPEKSHHKLDDSFEDKEISDVKVIKAKETNSEASENDEQCDLITLSSDSEDECTNTTQGNVEVASYCALNDLITLSSDGEEESKNVASDDALMSGQHMAIMDETSDDNEGIRQVETEEYKHVIKDKSVDIVQESEVLNYNSQKKSKLTGNKTLPVANILVDQTLSTYLTGTDGSYNSIKIDRKTAVKRSLQFSSEKQKSAEFDRVFGMMTYSRSPKRLKDVGYFVKSFDSRDSANDIADKATRRPGIETSSRTREAKECEGEENNDADKKLEFGEDSTDNYIEEDITDLNSESIEESEFLSGKFPNPNPRLHSTPKSIKGKKTKAKNFKRTNSSDCRNSGEQDFSVVKSLKKTKQSTLSQYVSEGNANKRKSNNKVKRKRTVIDEESDKHASDVSQISSDKSMSGKPEGNERKSQTAVLQDSQLQDESSIVDATGYTREAQLQAFRKVLQNHMFRP